MVNTGADLFGRARMPLKQRREVFPIFIVYPITRFVAPQHGAEIGFGCALCGEFARRELDCVAARHSTLPFFGFYTAF